MIKSELIKHIAAQHSHLYERDIEKLVNAILGTIDEALCRGNRVEIRGFGVFAVRKRRGRTGRNPRSGAVVTVNPKSFPSFKTGKEMHQRLNASNRFEVPTADSTEDDNYGFRSKAALPDLPVGRDGRHD
jgi:integration host factor subunit beta